jgi:hypothetical protein
MSFTIDYVRLFVLLALMLPLYAGVRFWLLSEPPRTEVRIVPETVTVHVPVEIEVPVDRIIFVPVPAASAVPVPEAPAEEPLDDEQLESIVAPTLGFATLAPGELLETDEAPDAADPSLASRGRRNKCQMTRDGVKDTRQLLT